MVRTEGAASRREPTIMRSLGELLAEGWAEELGSSRCHRAEVLSRNVSKGLEVLISAQGDRSRAIQPQGRPNVRCWSNSDQNECARQMTRSANRDIVRLSNETCRGVRSRRRWCLAGKMFAASPPDGHTLMLGESAMMAINPALFADLPYRPLQDFAPVTLLITVPTILVVPSSLGVSGLRDFIALAKSKPGR